MKNIFLSIVTALVSSLCCITPVLAIFAGSGSFISTFSWTEPLRPYLILLTFGLLGFAWFQKLKPKPELDCACEPEKKSSFLNSGLFLGLITVFVGLMLTFPYYASSLVANPKNESLSENPFQVNQVEFSIQGMTCSGCEALVEHELSKNQGIIKSTTSYQKGNTVIEFDPHKTSLPEIQSNLEKTGYIITQAK